ncbi:ammonium transporter [Clostridium merdae]|uniref:ammonium transporter n=1 Tax=Clostridium merdae TaxID=1958780 RepID=UPI000A26DD33|nr:ammonium transporter [Clostridium merdae]
MNTVNSGDISWMLTSSALVLIMTPGLALFYGGMAGRKNIVNTIMSSAFILGLASILWVLFGFSLSFSGGAGGIIGDLSWFGMNFTEDSAATAYAPTTVCFAVFQMMFAIITPALITGALIGRMRFSALILFITLWSIVVYYPLAHMVWGGGYLMELGAIDFAGGTVVHISSGVSALMAAIWLGKRKKTEIEESRAHNMPLVFLGAALLWFGWFGFNAGSAGAANTLAVHAFMTTNTACAAALLSWMLIEKMHKGKTTLSGVSTGIVVGLVAITPGAGFVPIWASLLIGALVSPICYFFITVVKPKFGYDDSLDAFGCHGIGGVWGAIATGVFAVKGFNPDPSADAVKWNGLFFGQTELLVRQLIAIGITLVLSLIGTAIALGVTQLIFKRIRVTPEEEVLGLDVCEHGEPAYPAFDGVDSPAVGYTFSEEVAAHTEKDYRTERKSAETVGG